MGSSRFYARAPALVQMGFQAGTVKRVNGEDRNPFAFHFFSTRLHSEECSGSGPKYRS